MKQGSFTQQVKDEICLGEYDESQLTALLSGFIKTNGIVSFSSTTSSLTASLDFFFLLTNNKIIIKSL